METIEVTDTLRFTTSDENPMFRRELSATWHPMRDQPTGAPIMTSTSHEPRSTHPLPVRVVNRPPLVPATIVVICVIVGVAVFAPGAIDNLSLVQSIMWTIGALCGITYLIVLLAAVRDLITVVSAGPARICLWLGMLILLPLIGIASYFIARRPRRSAGRNR